MVTSAQISELQDHYDGRGRLCKIANAIKCYTNTVSFYVSYTDGWGNKKNLNMPIEPEVILDILRKDVRVIDEDIARIMATFAIKEYKVKIVNVEDVQPSIEDYKSRHPETYTSLEKLYEELQKVLNARIADPSDVAVDADYHIEVCSDWKDKIYVFEYLSCAAGVVNLRFREIFKL